jgi:hypothetical protein
VNIGFNREARKGIIGFVIASRGAIYNFKSNGERTVISFLSRRRGGAAK